MDQPRDACRRGRLGDVTGADMVDGIERARATLIEDADQVDDPIGAVDRRRDRGRFGHRGA